MTWNLDTDHVENFAFALNIFTKEECEKIIEYGLTLPIQDGLVGNSNVVNNKIRKNKIAWISPDNDNKWFYEKIHQTIHYMNQRFFNFDISHTEQLQFTQYIEKDDGYKYHVDKMLNGTIRKLSLVIQLSDPKDYEGSELVLNYGEEETASKEQGAIIMFPSYVLHKVTPLVSGKRYSLVVWIGGKNFT